MHVVDEHQQTGDFHGLVDAEFTGRFHGVGEVAARIGQRQNLRLGRLGLQQEGREVGGIERVAHRAHDGAAVGFHDCSSVVFKGVAESIVSGQEEPGFVALFDQCGAGDLGQRHRVIGIVHGVGGAVFVGQAGRTGTNRHEWTFFLGCDLGHGQGRAGVGAANQHRQVVFVHPLACFGAGNVRLVLVVG